MYKKTMKTTYSESATYETLRDRGTIVTMFLTNGFQFKGTIKDFDDATVLFYSDGVNQMIYKHAISTIKPIK